MLVVIICLTHCGCITRSQITTTLLCDLPTVMDNAFPLAAYDFSEGDLLEVLSQMGVPTSGRLSHEETQQLLESLPALKEQDLVELGKEDAACPICITPFPALLAEEETAFAMDSPAYSSKDLGVTKLVQTCGHVFCRKDISKWIVAGNDSCPLCRRALLQRPDRATSGTDETATEERQDAPPFIPETTQELLERLFRQGNMFVDNTGGRRRDDPDTREFSGMYS
ncbi:hypothetical protein NEOLEDRAFT_591020 [Neolentinus lepideus HHB14362 ss-1]|uniref:RING-type domain-containing protein n=1 Tax=Neolentinus lepideus HHB14362 ss-1 TaxID=1314782 RepID=A0A165V8F9_9AGAM|nr:hypothetical protein NEOLEDRAFT_591020 [Neolentinus lepideus HHB14362 ss-1]